MPIKYNSFSASDVGIKRTNNEDAYGSCATSIGKVYIVCDGMGGHAGGERASEIAVSTIQSYFQESFGEVIPLAISEALKHANRNIWDEAQNNPELSGMGTTCILAFLHNNGDVYLGHVGDSRCYHFNENNELLVLTKDHSYVQFLIETGDVDVEAAFDHPAKNRILKALGIDSDVTPTITQEPYRFGAKNSLLLCTDGLNDMLRDEEIRQIMMKNNLPEEQVEKLIQSALDKGGKDNVTVTAIQIIESPFGGGIQLEKTPKKNKRKLLGAIFFLVIFAFSFTYVIFLSKDEAELNENPKEGELREENVRKDSIPEKNMTIKVDQTVVKPDIVNTKTDRIQKEQVKDTVAPNSKPVEESTIDSIDLEE